MTNRIFTGAAPLRLAATLVALLSAAAAMAAPADHRPLPSQVVSQVPGLHPLGKGRHSWWGIQMYDATLWIAGPRWSASEPHALDLEPRRTVSADALVKTAIDEMRELKVGDESQLEAWQAEMNKIIPSVRAGDQVVTFCPDTRRTQVFLNESSNGEVDDPSFCPAVMSVCCIRRPSTRRCAKRCSENEKAQPAPTGALHRPAKRGWRFSMNARTPSR